MNGYRLRTHRREGATLITVPWMQSILCSSFALININIRTTNMVNTFTPLTFSPVQRARKFSTVFGTTSFRRVISILPAGFPPIEMSKNTTGLAMMFLDVELNEDSERIYMTAVEVRGDDSVNITVRWGLGLCKTSKATSLFFTHMHTSIYMRITTTTLFKVLHVVSTLTLTLSRFLFLSNYSRQMRSCTRIFVSSTQNQSIILPAKCGKDVRRSHLIIIQRMTRTRCHNHSFFQQGHIRSIQQK